MYKHNYFLYTSRISLSILVIIATATANAQQFRITTLPTQQQLPVANVRCVMQDSEGYVWYGTSGGGVCRDNGYQVDVFRSDNRTPGLLESNDVTCLAEDSRHGIWIGTWLGAYRIDKLDYSVKPMLKDEIGQRTVKTLFADSRKNLWVGAGDFIVQTDSVGNVRRRFLSQWNGKNADVNCFMEDPDGALWIGQWQGGICRYDEEHDTLEQHPWDYAFSPVKMLPGHGKEIWVATWGGGIVGYYLVTGVISPQSTTMGSPRKQQILSFIRDSRQGLYWVTTMDNLYIYQEQNGELRACELPLALPSGGKILDKMAEDSDGNVWVPGFAPTTFIVSSGTSIPLRYEVADMLHLTGYPLLADRVVADGDLFWIWQGRHGLTLYDPASGRVSDAGGNLYVSCIQKRQDTSGIWAAHGNTIYQLTVGTRSAVAKVDDDVLTLLDSGGYLYIGTRKSLYRYSIIGGFLDQVAVTEAAVREIAVMPSGDFYYVVEGKGLYGPGGLIYETPHLTALTVTPDGTLWAATCQGDVLHMNNGQMVRDEDASDERGDAIKDILADDRGHLWILSDQRVREINPQGHSMRLLRTDDPEIRAGFFYCLEPVDGRHVLIAGTGVFCIVESSAWLDRKQAQTRPPMVTTVIIDDSLLLMPQGCKSVEISAQTGSVTLRLSTQEHLDASKVSFAYMLRGLHKKWIYLPQGNNIVHMTGLEKGKYVLVVKATDVGGCWGEPVECLVIHKLPQWWQTWWARLLFAAVIILLLYSLWLLRNRIVQLRTLMRKRKEIVVTEIELHPEDLESSKIDVQFLQRAVQIIEQHLDDSDYSVEQFGNDMCMSRMNLYRKLQTITGQSPTEFMRDLRLKKAAQLLKSMPDAPVSEVAAKVGFATPSYFTKCFKQRFGILPTLYGKQQE